MVVVVLALLVAGLAAIEFTGFLSPSTSSQISVPSSTSSSTSSSSTLAPTQVTTTITTTTSTTTSSSTTSTITSSSSLTSVVPQVIQIVMVPNSGVNRSLGFSPSVVKVVIGVNNTVEWVNEDSVQHTATSAVVPNGAIPFNYSLNPGATITVTFTVPGNYEYYCIYHSWMTGEIEVVSG